MNRILHVLMLPLLVLFAACSDDAPAPVSAVAPGTPTQGTTGTEDPGTADPGTAAPGTAEPATPGVDPALLVILQEKIREHRAEMTRIAEDADLTPAELSAYAASIGRPLPAEINPAEIPNMQRMMGANLQRTPGVDQMVPLVIRTEGPRALFVYRHAAAPPSQLILGSTLFERDGANWRLLRSFGTDSPIPAGMSADDAARARLHEPDFSEFYSERELPPLALEAGSLASDLRLWTRSTERQCTVSIGGVQVLEGSGDANMLLMGREFGRRHPLGQSPLAKHFALRAGNNPIAVACQGSSTTPVELRLTRRGESLPSLVVVLDPSAGEQVSGSFDLSETVRDAPTAAAFITNRADGSRLNEPSEQALPDNPRVRRRSTVQPHMAPDYQPPPG
ncbi:MAG: hypothetical protein AB8H86_32265 [Polyangiales bacterium]